MRRKKGRLLGIEIDILEAGVGIKQRGERGFHGFSVAKAIQEEGGARQLTSHGTLYKALARLERAGLLESEWEPAERAAAEGRPRRRLYEVTGLGEQALALELADRHLPAAVIEGLASP